MPGSALVVVKCPKAGPYAAEVRVSDWNAPEAQLVPHGDSPHLRFEWAPELQCCLAWSGLCTDPVSVEVVDMPEPGLAALLTALPLLWWMWSRR